MLGSSLPSQQIGPFRELTLLASHEAISSEALQHPAAPPRCFLRMLFEPAPLAESCLMTCPETLQGGFLALLSLAVALLLYGEGSHGGTGSFLVGGSRRKGAGSAPTTRWGWGRGWLLAEGELGSPPCVPVVIHGLFSRPVTQFFRNRGEDFVKL